MSLVKTATAIGVLTAVGAQYGWANALAATGVLALAVLLLRVTRQAPQIFRANGGHLSERKARRLADYIVCVAAALSKKQSGRDLALEAISTLDDMAEDGHGLRCIMLTALWLALRLPGSVRGRSSSKIGTPSPAGDKNPVLPSAEDRPANSEIVTEHSDERILTVRTFKGGLMDKETFESIRLFVGRANADPSYQLEGRGRIIFDTSVGWEMLKWLPPRDGPPKGER